MPLLQLVPTKLEIRLGMILNLRRAVLSGILDFLHMVYRLSTIPYVVLGKRLFISYIVSRLILFHRI